MRVLLIEDDEKLCGLIAAALEREGYETDYCHEGDDGLRWMGEQAYDLVLLDRMLPQMDGIKVLRRARERGILTPVLMITALDSLGQKVEGLDAGADDYIAKPFEMAELLARMRALLRRPRAWEPTQILECGDTAYTPHLKTLACRSKTTVLSKKEGALMELLLQNAGQALPRSLIFTRVWGPDTGIEDSNLDNYISFLRRRLRGIGSGLAIETIRGVGYRVKKDDV